MRNFGSSVFDSYNTGANMSLPVGDAYLTYTDITGTLVSVPYNFSTFESVFITMLQNIRGTIALATSTVEYEILYGDGVILSACHEPILVNHWSPIGLPIRYYPWWIEVGGVYYFPTFYGFAKK